MHTGKAFTILSVAAVLGCRLLVTALPRVEYIRVIDETILIDNSGDDDDDLFHWSLYSTAHYHGGPAFDAHTDPDTNSVSDEQPYADIQASDDTGLGAVKIPATVYPHDTPPTATLSNDDTDPPSNPLLPCVATSSKGFRHQPRNALPNPAEDNEVIPSSLQAMEASAPPVETSSLPEALLCTGLSSCPKGYKTYILMGLCWCRLPPPAEG
ncbi:hypothetical protein A1O3_09034 [Capronia epimyces CBS 606.96]|uniref:Uncharacterized protein n=1 Tax=Capronia epimyces CBS 606.96 TaxID=1182542 RepID=W9XKN9_9EURO|nr:uncharacterized protein A1O3_09034 [Capronia epimyces CBS 606.96]EXJ77875.1 hypothetical protein A1O3_09034 [Capronia epimyces CBS 606.96]